MAITLTSTTAASRKAKEKELFSTIIAAPRKAKKVLVISTTTIATCGILLVLVIAQIWEIKGFLPGNISWVSYTNVDFSSSSSSSTATARHKKRIQAKLIQNLPLHGLHADGTYVHYRCEVGKPVDQPRYHKIGGTVGNFQPLPRRLLNATGVFDSHVHIEYSDLKIMIVGNSLSQQLHGGLEEALCYSRHAKETGRMRENLLCDTGFAKITQDPVFRGDSRLVRAGGKTGGGMLFHGFVLALIDTYNWDIEIPNVFSMIQGIKSFSKENNTDNTMNNIESNNNNNNKTGVEDIKPLADVFLFQFPSGHVSMSVLDDDLLMELVYIASNLFQATSLVLPTIAWHNNVGPNEVEFYHRANGIIRNFAKQFTPTRTVQTVQVLDFAALSLQYIDANGLELGIPRNKTYTFRLSNKFQSVVAHACGTLPFPDDPKGCHPGMVSLDGIHWCPETIHGRLNAGLVCLLDCRYNVLDETTFDILPRATAKAIQECSDACNVKYMSLEPIEFPENGEIDLT